MSDEEGSQKSEEDNDEEEDEEEQEDQDDQEEDDEVPTPKNKLANAKLNDNLSKPNQQNTISSIAQDQDDLSFDLLRSFPSFGFQQHNTQSSNPVQNPTSNNQKSPYYKTGQTNPYQTSNRTVPNQMNSKFSNMKLPAKQAFFGKNLNDNLSGLNSLSPGTYIDNKELMYTKELRDFGMQTGESLVQQEPLNSKRKDSRSRNGASKNKEKARKESPYVQAIDKERDRMDYERKFQRKPGDAGYSGNAMDRGKKPISSLYERSKKAEKCFK